MSAMLRGIDLVLRAGSTREEPRKYKCKRNRLPVARDVVHGGSEAGTSTTSSSKHVYAHEKDPVKCAVSLVWKSEEAAHRAQFNHVHRLLQYTAPEQFRNPARSSSETGNHVGPCNIVPKDFQEWVDHKTAVIEMSKQEELKNIAIKTERREARKRMKDQGVKDLPIKSIFGVNGRVFDDGRGPVVGQPTVWSIEHDQLKLPTAAWPGQEELQLNGDLRENSKAQTRCGRYLPLPRAPPSEKLPVGSHIPIPEEASVAETISLAGGCRDVDEAAQKVIVRKADAASAIAEVFNTENVPSTIELGNQAKDFESVSMIDVEATVRVVGQTSALLYTASSSSMPFPELDTKYLVEEPPILKFHPLDKVGRHQDPHYRYINDPQPCEVEEANMLDNQDLGFIAHGKHLLGNQLLHEIGHWGLLFQVGDEAIQPMRCKIEPTQAGRYVWYFDVSTGCWSDDPISQGDPTRKIGK